MVDGILQIDVMHAKQQRQIGAMQSNKKKRSTRNPPRKISLPRLAKKKNTKHEKRLMTGVELRPCASDPSAGTRRTKGTCHSIVPCENV